MTEETRNKLYDILHDAFCGKDFLHSEFNGAAKSVLDKFEEVDGYNQALQDVRENIEASLALGKGIDIDFDESGLEIAKQIIDSLKK